MSQMTLGVVDVEDDGFKVVVNSHQLLLPLSNVVGWNTEKLLNHLVIKEDGFKLLFGEKLNNGISIADHCKGAITIRTSQ